MSALKPSLKSLRVAVVGKVFRLHEKELFDINSKLDHHLFKNSLEGKICDKLLSYLSLPKVSLQQRDKLTLFIEKNWSIIKANNLLTEAFIRYFESSTPHHDQRLFQRVNKDSRSGGEFEDKFWLLLSCFLGSKKSLCSKNGVFPFLIECNPSVQVQGEGVKHPDITIKYNPTGNFKCFLELKKSYKSRSLKKDSDRQLAWWRTISDTAGFYYVIFSTSSGKVKLYKKESCCRVICTGLRSSEKQLNECPTPTIIDPLEQLFEEIYTTLKKSKATKKKQQ